MVILLVALVVLGPDQLPKAMRTFGNVMAEVRKVSGGFQAEMRKAMDSIDTTVNPSEDKPMSAKPPSGQPDDHGTTPADPDVTEVVARNADPAPAPPSEDTSDFVNHRPVDPADRAAG